MIFIPNYYVDLNDHDELWHDPFVRIIIRRDAVFCREEIMSWCEENYEELYCSRGEMENRIKEQQLYLFADRTSTAIMKANQLRL